MQNEIIELLNPEECNDYPGYFYYPENKDIIVSKNGDCIKLSTQHKLVFFNNEKSYIYNNLVINKNRRLCISQHRILARTFIGRPKRHWNKPFEELQVNHKDGNKLNNSLDNLEWMTYTENRNHAYETGLHSNNIKVLARNVFTNKIYSFRSISKCAEKFNIIIFTLTEHLKSKYVGKKIKYDCVFKYDDNTAWPEININKINKLGDIFLPVLVKDLLTKKIIRFNSVAQCSRKFDLNRTILKAHLKTNSSGKYYKNNCVFKYDDGKPWKDYLPMEMRELGYRGINVSIYDKNTNNIFIYDNIKEAADSVNINDQTLKYHLRKKNIYCKDNYVFTKL